MDFDTTLGHLKNQFPGAMVLYVDDIATILGKSKKATSHLLSRDGLPFKIKKVGGLRCVDIFQVAQWLCSSDELAQDAEQEPAAAPFVGVNRGAKSSRDAVASNRGARPGQASSRDEPDESTYGFMALNILKERREQHLNMQRFVHALSDPNEKAFMSKVLEAMVFSEATLPSSYSVTLKKLAPQYFKVRAELRTTYFESKEDAIYYLITKLSAARHYKGNCITHLTLEQSGETLFHAVSSKLNSLSVENNVVGLELLGL